MRRTAGLREPWPRSTSTTARCCRPCWRGVWGRLHRNPRREGGSMSTVIVGTRNTSRWPEFAGSTWVRLQYLLGLRRLGVDSFWVERLIPVDPLEHPHSLEYLVRRFERTVRDFGLEGRCCIVY